MKTSSIYGSVILKHNELLIIFSSTDFRRLFWATEK